jgi:hypothetical protein
MAAKVLLLEDDADQLARGNAKRKCNFRDRAQHPKAFNRIGNWP